MARQTGVGGRPSRSWSDPPGVIARGRNLQDAGHGANGIHGLVRAHQPVNPFGSPCSPARTRLPPLPGCRAPDAGDGSHVEGAPVPPAQRLSARQRACRHPARLASPKWRSTGRSARTHAPALRRASGSHQIDHLSPELRQDQRLGNGASDTSKINSRVSTKPGQLHGNIDRENLTRVGLSQPNFLGQ